MPNCLWQAFLNVGPNTENDAHGLEMSRSPERGAFAICEVVRPPTPHTDLQGDGGPSPISRMESWGVQGEGAAMGRGGEGEFCPLASVTRPLPPLLLPPAAPNLSSYMLPWSAVAGDLFLSPRCHPPPPWGIGAPTLTGDKIPCCSTPAMLPRDLFAPPPPPPRPTQTKQGTEIWRMLE